MGIYLDYNASTPIDERVLKFMVDVYRNNYGNSDSRTHEYGNEAKRIVEESRVKVASVLKIEKDEVFFTSGATESNNIVIQGLREYGEKHGKKHIISTNIEHKTVLENVKNLVKYGFEVDLVSPDETGRVSSEKIISLVRDDTLLVCVMHVNNETGIIQPVKEIGDYLSKRNVFFHIDATQSFGKMIDELQNIKYDTLVMSAHKIYGPQGIGALIMRKKHYRFPPIKNLMFGGQQERGIRPGTVPVALVAGLGKACELATLEYKKRQKHNLECKKTILRLLDESGLVYGINGNQEYCVDSTLSLFLKGISSEALMLATKHFCGMSNGSACNSQSYKLSYVLEAMGLPKHVIQSTIRISWGQSTDISELEISFKSLLQIALELA